MNTVRGSLPIVEYLKYSITNCLKGENFMAGRELILLPFFFFSLEKYVGFKKK